MSSGRLAAGPRHWRGKRQHGPAHATEFPVPYQDAGGGCAENAEPSESVYRKAFGPSKRGDEIGENIAAK
jgi:hypothetical protein